MGTNILEERPTYIFTI